MFNRIFKRLYWLYLRLVSTPLELALISGVILGKNCQINKYKGYKDNTNHAKGL